MKYIILITIMALPNFSKASDDVIKISPDNPCVGLREFKSGLDYASEITFDCATQDCGKRAAAMKASWEDLSKSIDSFCKTVGQ